MKIILFGAPGAGKGTVGDRIALHYGFCKISTGDLIRAEIRSESPLGNKLKKIAASGQLVDDLTVIELVKRFLERSENRTPGYIFDGFPRTLEQAKELSTINPQQKEISFLLKVEKEVVIRRLTARLTCVKCNAIFNLISNPPRKEGICDHCSGELVRREDDNEKTIGNRIEVYLKETAPVIDYYRRNGKLIEIDGCGTVDEVFSRVQRYLDDLLEN